MRRRSAGFGRASAALGRLDVLPTLDGIDDGMWALGALQARGVTVLNDVSALYATHDKLLTARLLRRVGLPHPRTAHVRPDRPFAAVRPPVVVKPRFGSGGQGVTWCADEDELVETLSSLSSTPWFEQQGVLVQELVPPQGYDLRILVAAGRVVGAIFRIAADGEWRTNVALGGVRRPVPDPPRAACEIALRGSSCSRCSARRSRSRAGRRRRLDRDRAERRGRVHPSSTSPAGMSSPAPPGRSSAALHISPRSSLQRRRCSDDFRRGGRRRAEARLTYGAAWTRTGFEVAELAPLMFPAHTRQEIVRPRSERPRACELLTAWVSTFVPRSHR